MDFDKQHDAVMHQAEEWATNFTKSLFYKQLSREKREEASWIVERYIDFMFNYYDRMPGKWTQKDTIDVVGYYFPRKITADEAFFKCVVPVLEKFFQYLSNENIIKNGETLIKGLKKAEKELLDNIDNPDIWGPAKQLAMSAEEFGVDLSNEEELAAFVTMLNQQSGALQKFEEEKKKLNRSPITVTKIGRNDPCPCGSGKKYKKCHGLDG